MGLFETDFVINIERNFEDETKILVSTVRPTKCTLNDQEIEANCGFDGMLDVCVILTQVLPVDNHNQMVSMDIHCVCHKCGFESDSYYMCWLDFQIELLSSAMDCNINVLCAVVVNAVVAVVLTVLWFVDAGLPADHFPSTHSMSSSYFY